MTLENDNNEQICKYGLQRLNYIKENKKGLYTTLLMGNELTNHLLSVSNECEEKLKTSKPIITGKEVKINKKNL